MTDTVISQCICGPPNNQQALRPPHIPWTLWLVSGKSAPQQWSCTSPQWCQQHSRGLGRSSKCLFGQKRKWTWTETDTCTRIKQFKRLITIVHLLFTVVEVLADACRVVPGSHWVLQALDHSADVLQGLENCCTMVQNWQVHALENWLKNTTKTLSNITFFINANANSNRTTNTHWSYGNEVKVTKLTCGLSAASESTKTWNLEPRSSFLYQGRQEALIL